jgi:hypothetical protein
MLLSVIWPVTSFAIRLLVIILLRSCANARFRGSGAKGGEVGRDIVLVDEDYPPNGRPCGRSPGCTNSFLRLKRKR